MVKQKKGMVDVSSKKATKRRALAHSRIVLGKKAYKALLGQKSPKGNVLEAAKIAVIMAAKTTSQIIPMCHPLSINQVLVNFKCDDKNHAVTTIVEVNYEGKTGVEMEALLGASVGSLTIYDMMKWADKGMTIENTYLVKKRGGKSGDYIRPKI